MNRILRGGLAGLGLVCVLALTGCSAEEHSERASFDFAGQELDVVPRNMYMDVSVSSDGSASERVTVEVGTQTKWQRPKTPAWSLTEGTLDLGNPCVDKMLSYCEGSYSIRVPEGTRVTINGRPVPVE